MLAAFFLASFNSLSRTGLSISDTDPSSYIIVVMLMLFPFILFSGKERISVQGFSLSGTGAAAGIFLAYALATMVSRGSLSYLFWSYRIDALLFPALLACLAAALFGMRSLPKFKYLLVFALFASPAILMPLLAQNPLFASINAGIVFDMIRATGVHVVRHGFLIAAPSGATISINTTCVPLGTFVALLFFLLPIAYLYNGARTRKALWLASGLALVLLLNLVRMSIIAFAWVYNGIGPAAATFHLFAGAALFLLTIVAMVLLTGRYGLSFPHGEATAGAGKRKARRGRSRAQRSPSPYRFALGAAAAFAFAALAFVLTLPYAHLEAVPAAMFAGNGAAANRATSANIGLALYTSAFVPAGSGMRAAYLGSDADGGIFLLADNQSEALAIVNASPAPVQRHLFVGYNSIKSTGSYILKNGITINSAIVESEGHAFYTDYFSAPFTYNSTTFSMSYVVFTPANQSSHGLCEVRLRGAGMLNYLESEGYNILGHMRPANGTVLCEAYEIASS